MSGQADRKPVISEEAFQYLWSMVGDAVEESSMQPISMASLGDLHYSQENDSDSSLEDEKYLIPAEEDISDLLSPIIPEISMSPDSQSPTVDSSVASPSQVSNL